MGSNPKYSTNPICRVKFFDVLIYKFKSKVYNFTIIEREVIKCVWWMPWHSEAMKDVISCDKLRVGANNL